jgi:hypothetical protein
MGRPTGKLVGLTADVKDEVTAIQVAQSNGDVSQYPIGYVRLINGHPVLLQTWRVEAEGLRREHDIIKRRNQALDLLLKDGDIEQPEYNQQRSNYEDLNKEINEKRDTLLDTLKQVEGRLDQQIRDLQSALTNNKMLFTASEIREDTYHTVTESIRSGLDISRKERKDLDSIYHYLQAIDSLEAPPPMTFSSPAPETSPEALPHLSPQAILTKVPTPPSSAKSLPDIVVIKMKESA